MLDCIFYLLAAFTLPRSPQLVVAIDPPGECAVTAIGSVEAYLELHYNHEDPAAPGMHYQYTSDISILTNQTASVAYDWRPVAFEWYYKPYGELLDGVIVSPDPVDNVYEGDYQLGLVCGVVPSAEYVPPTEEPEYPAEDCPANVVGSVEMYLKAYYWHESPDVPGLRFTYTTEMVLAENEEVGVEYAEFPAAVEWWYRPYGVVVAANDGWILGRVCGEVPGEVVGSLDSDAVVMASVRHE